ncbi:MAG: hypothetical protein LQ349_007193 [Xanthoria aureola]|nr:MAG: hypothetical protein LQ349_007193 [Xanthoria aureola]
MSSENAPDPVTDALQGYTTCDISDALLKLKHPHGGFLTGLTMYSPNYPDDSTKIVGRAFTVKYIPRSEEAAVNLEGHYIDQVAPGSVVFISAPQGTVNALYGGLMSCRAQYLGAAGTVVDGRIRDLREHRQLAYPVFARGMSTVSPQEKLRVGEVNCRVSLQSPEQLDTIISPGDYLIGDIDGVVCLPQALAEQVVALMPSQVVADEGIMGALKNGGSFTNASKEHRAGIKSAEDL